MLSKAVFATVVYYDAFDFPLTEFEVWKHLLNPEGSESLRPVSLGAVMRTINTLVTEERIVREQGFLMLPGRTSLVAKRIAEEKYAVSKLKRAARLARWCAWLPFLRMIAITGSLSMKQGDAKSDWDFLVVIRSGSIWTGRLCLTLWLALLGRRRHGRKIQDRACLNCYLADQSMEVPMRDLFSSHEYRFLYPVFGRDTFRAFELANRWMSRYRPQFLPTVVANRFLRPIPRWQTGLQSMLERVLSSRWLEERLAAWQKKKIATNPKTALPDGFISATDEALIFLPEPKGPKIFETFKKRLSEASW